MAENIDITNTLSVVCFDDPVRRNFFYIDQNSYQMGKIAAKKLKEYTESGKIPDSTVLTPRLIIDDRE